jgi:hypothetical protein
MERIFKVAKANGYDVFISPSFFYPTDTGWKMPPIIRGSHRTDRS